MKKQLKICLLLLLFIFSSCEKELYDEAIQQSSIAKNHYHLKTKTFTELNKKNYFVDAYNKSITALKNKNTAQNKLIYGINVDTTYINEVTATNYKSYSFKILDQEESQAYFKNLIIEIDAQQRVSAEVAKYNIDVNKTILSIESIVIIPKEIEEIINSGDSNKCFYYEIITQTSCGCEGQHYDDDEDCDCPDSPPSSSVQMIIDCGAGFDSGSLGPLPSTGNGSIPSTGGLGVPNNTTHNITPIITAPVHGAQPINHLGKLYDLIKIAEPNESPNIIRNKVKTFKNDLKNEILENGVEYRRTGFVNNKPVYIPIYPIERTPTSTEFGPPAINTAVYIHFHPDIIFGQINGENILACPIPSTDDFSEFANKFNLMGPNSNRNNLTSIVVTRSGLFAMRVEDPNKVLAFNQYMSIGNNKSDFKDSYKENVIKKSKEEAEIKIAALTGLTDKQKEAILDLEFKKCLAQFILEFNNNTIDTGILLFFGDIEGAETTWNQLQTTNEP